MNQINLVNPIIISIAAQLPEPSWTTDELLEASGDRFSEKLREMLSKLGVNKRHSFLKNYPAVLFNDAVPEIAISGTALAVKTSRRCIEQANVDPHNIGFILGVTSSPSRLLPSLVCDMIAQMQELRRDIERMSMEYMGCSAIADALDRARQFLSCYPNKFVLVLFMDAITPLSPPLPGKYAHFTEVSSEESQATVNVMHGFLFGDATVAMILSAEGQGPKFGPSAHLTNVILEDAELGTVPDGGSDIPVVYGRRLYTLSPDVAARGVFYATETVKNLIENKDCKLNDPKDATMVLMHTGSERILDALCEHFGISPKSPSVSSSYKILREFGNTIGCSVPLMIADPEYYRAEGEELMVAFGLSFSCGACEVTIPPGGWMP